MLSFRYIAGVLGAVLLIAALGGWFRLVVFRGGRMSLDRPLGNGKFLRLAGIVLIAAVAISLIAAVAAILNLM